MRAVLTFRPPAPRALFLVAAVPRRLSLTPIRAARTQGHKLNVIAGAVVGFLALILFAVAPVDVGAQTPPAATWWVSREVSQRDVWVSQMNGIDTGVASACGLVSDGRDGYMIGSASDLIPEACTVVPGTEAQETAAATTCTLAPYVAGDAAADPPVVGVVGSCAVSAGSGTCTYNGATACGIGTMDELDAACGDNVILRMHCEHDLCPSGCVSRFTWYRPT